MSKKSFGLWGVGVMLALLAMMLMPTAALARQGSTTFNLRVVGTLEAMNADNVVVSGQTFDTTTAEVEAGLAVGDLVEVRFVLDLSTGERTATAVTKFEVPLPELAFVGELEELGMDFVVVAGHTFDTTTAKVEADLVAGDLVRVRFTIEADGTLIASEVHMVEAPNQPTPPTTEFTVLGRLQALDATSVEVAGRTFDTTNAEVEADLTVGDWVMVTFTVAEDGTLIASSVAAAELPQPSNAPEHPAMMVGELEALNADSIVVRGQTFDTTNAEVEAGLAVGDWVRVEFTVATDGSLVATKVAKLQLPQHPNSFSTIGELTELNTDTALIGGLTYDVTGATIEEGVEVGDLVRVTFGIETADSIVTLVASEIQKLGSSVNDPSAPPSGQPPVNQPSVGQAPQNPQPANQNPQPPANPVPSNNNASNMSLNIIGQLEAISTISITVNGQVISTTSLNVAADLEVGMTVRVEIRIVNGVVSGSVTVATNPSAPANSPNLPNPANPINPVNPGNLPVQPPQIPNGQPPQIPPVPACPPQCS
ncbi:MAG: hypothetical protein HY862_17465 [Chloroflexi bacterium]|nr:hypothetical protein [Chloroflexota bacterium]